MDFSLSIDEVELAEQARSVATAAAATYGTTPDSWMNGFSKEFSLELGRLGWIGMSWPAQYGGGRPPLHRLIVGEELIKAGAPIAASWFADRQIGPVLIAYGTDEQRSKYLPDIRSGSSTWCIGMSEPQAGSDLAALSTFARREGDEWVISGQKIWTSHADVADYCYLICRTDRSGPRHSGISEIIVPMESPGIDVRPIVDMTGNKHFCEVFFDEVRVPAENLVGQEGAAFSQTMKQLGHERGGIDRLVSNFLLYKAALKFADLDDPGIRKSIAELETGYHIGRLLVTRGSLGQSPPEFSALTKAFCADHEQRVADFAWRVVGPAASVVTELTPALTYAPSYSIMGGTSQILRNIIADRLIGLPR